MMYYAHFSKDIKHIAELKSLLIQNIVSVKKTIYEILLIITFNHARIMHRVNITVTYMMA